MRLLLPYPPLQLPRLTRWGAAVALSEFPQLSIANVDRSLNFDRHSLRVVDDYQHQPNTATLEVFGFTPALGDRVVVRSVGTDGNYNRKEFSGQITRRTKKFDRLNDRLVWRLTCIDGTYEASGVLITAAYGSQSASVTAHSLMASAPSGFGTAFIEAGLPTVAAIQFKMTPLPDALSQLCDAFGGGWYWDEDNALHLFTTDTSETPDTIDSTTTVRAFRWEEQIESVVNRILVEGLGSNVVGGVTASASRIPLDSVSMFSASGGTAITGLQRFTYTGTAAGGGASSVGYGPAPEKGPPATTSATFSQLTATSWYTWALTFQTAAGETTPGPRGPAYLSDAAQRSADLSGLAVGEPGVTARKLYRTAGQASAAAAQTATLQFEQNLPNLTATAFTGFGVGDFALGATAPTITTGRTTLPVRDCAPFSAGGGSVLVAGMVLTYTGRSTSSGPGDLTGIPSSGAGSITGTIAADEAVTNLSVLTGVSGLTAALQAGDEINLLVQRDDASSQTTYGVRQKYIQDRRLSITGATTRGDAELTIGKDPRVTGSFVAEDVKLRSGRPITISMASEWGVDDTYTITRVEKYFEENRPTLQRRVEFSSASIDRNLFEVLRRIQGSIREAA